MKQLAFDTSNQDLVVAFAQDDEIKFQRFFNTANTHSINLLPVIQEGLVNIGWQINEIDQLIVASGPGSFTGLRIGISVAKTLAKFQPSMQLITVSSLQVISEALNSNLTQNKLLVPLFNARNENVFAGGYVNHKNVIEDDHYPIDSFLKIVSSQSKKIQLPVVFMGDVLNFKEKIQQVFFDSQIIDNVEINGVALISSSHNGQLITQQTIDDLVPNYLRKTQAQLNWELTHPQSNDESYVQKI